MEFLSIIATFGDMINRVMKYISETRLINLGKDQAKKEAYDEIDRRIEISKKAVADDDGTIDDELRDRYKNIK